MGNSKERVNHWNRTRKLLFLGAGLLVIPLVLIPMFTATLDSWGFFGFPFGFYMVAQGSFILMIAIAFWHIGRQENIDRDHGVSEEL